MTDLPPDDTEPTTGAPQEDLTFLEGHDPAALAELEAAGVGEGDFEDDDVAPPADALEAYEAMEWANACAAEAGDPLPHPEVGVPPPPGPGVERSSPLHSRAEVGLRAPKSRTALRTAEGDTLHYGGPSPWPASADRSSAERFRATTDHNRCATIWRGYQRYHMDTRGWSDIAYNSGTCPHGHRYEGRGPGIRSAANGTTTGNNRSYATCSMTGDSDPLPNGEKVAILDEGTSSRLIVLRWVHSDWKSTGCPGGPRRTWKQAGFPRPAGTTPPPTPRPPTPRPPTGGTVAVNLPVLKRGIAKPGAVKSLQGLLVDKAGQGVTLGGARSNDHKGVDGDFGARTDAAVRNVQRFFGLDVDGVVGQATWSVLFV